MLSKNGVTRNGTMEITMLSARSRFAEMIWNSSVANRKLMLLKNLLYRTKGHSGISKTIHACSSQPPT
jgi:hypothetical protein